MPTECISIAMILLDRSCNHDPTTEAEESSGGPSH
jgi:hypothetical protein